MTMTVMPAPVIKTVHVKADPKRAFDVFVAKIGSWWPKDHRIGAVPFADIVIEPRAGGRFFERGTDGSECDWGQVLAYEPGERLLLGWQLNGDWVFDAVFMVEVEVTFTAEDDGTLVRLEHRNLERYGERAAEVAASISGDGGWPGILEGFRQCCDG